MVAIKYAILYCMDIRSLNNNKYKLRKTFCDVTLRSIIT